MADFIDTTVPTPTAGNCETPEEYEKLTTSKLADKLGILVTALYDRLIGRGYLELRDGGKRCLTAKGKSAGGEFRMGKGSSFRAAMAFYHRSFKADKSCTIITRRVNAFCKRFKNGLGNQTN